MKSLNPVIIDYRSGNLRSVIKALEHLGASPRVTDDPKVVANARTIVFPGQGACDQAMRTIESQGLGEVIKESILKGTPFLGICVGLQLLLERSEEGNTDCMGIIPGSVRKLPKGPKVPHMGWNNVRLLWDHPVFSGIPQNSYFYFVHSYYPEPDSWEFVSGTTFYGFEFCSALIKGNMVATQFHPEKSGKWGLKLYKNFLEFSEDRA